MNGISSYSLWWIIIHSDWYRYHGDRAYLAEQRPYLTALLRQLFEKIGPDGRERLDGAFSTGRRAAMPRARRRVFSR